MTPIRLQETQVRTTSPHGFEGGLLEGTEIRTPCGPRKIEHVRRGDLIVTRHYGLQPVAMVWKRELTQNDIRANPASAPIRLKARAIGPMMPQRDLGLAPTHRILVPGWRLRGVDDGASGLVAAKALAGTSDAVYVDRSMEVARFYTLVFDEHRIYCADGIPVESVSVTQTVLKRLDDELRDEVKRQFPQLRKTRKAYPPRAFPTVADARYLPVTA